MDFRILGPLEVADGEQQLVAIGGGKQRALLALLLLHAGEVVTRDQLIDALWDGRPPATAPKSVQLYVSQLRKALRAGTTNGADGMLCTRAGGYVVELPPDALDLRRFEREREAGRRALEHARPDVAAERLRGALAMWRGPPLADFRYDGFAQDDIARLEELRLSALEECLEADLQLGRHAEVVAELEALVAEHPLREGLRAQLMLALYRADRQAEALAVYRDGRERLVGELGLEPTPRLQELEQAILEQRPALAPPVPARPAPRRRKPPATAAPPARSRTPAAGLARHRGRLLAAGAALLAIAGVAAALRLDGSGGDGRPTIVAPLRVNALAAVRADGRTIDAAVPVPGRLGRLAVGDGLLWIGSDDSRTISAVDPRTRRVTRTVVPGAFPSDVAVGDGAVWVVDGHRGVLVRVPWRYGRDVKRLTFRARGAPGPAPPADRFSVDPTAVAVGAGGVWVTDGARRLLRVDPRSGDVATEIPTDRPLSGVAVGAGAVWAISGTTGAVLRIDPRDNRVTDTIVLTGRPGTASPQPIAVAAGHGAVWVLNGNTSTVTRIDPRDRNVADTARVGVDHLPTQVAAAPGGAWVANADGTLSRIDARTGDVTTAEIGWGLRDVAVVGEQVWVSNQQTRCCGQE